MGRPARIAVALALALGVGAAAGIGVVAAGSGADRGEPVEVVAPALTLAGTGDAEVLRPIHGFRAGEVLVPSLEAFATPAPVPGTPPSSTLPNPTREGRALVVGIIESDPTGAWLHVRLPQRPNGSTGWIRATDVRTFEAPNRIEVNVTTNQLRVLRGDTDEVLFEALVSTGRSSTPTPLGDYFVDIMNPLGHHRVYGWGQMSVSGFSDVLYSFGGGIGQIAIHGWNDDSVMGRSVSNGCIRMRNQDIARVAELAGLGSPVRITA